MSQLREARSRLAFDPTLTDDRAMLRVALFLPLLLAACPKDETISGFADSSAIYALAELDGQRFAPRATISFPQEGLVKGNGPCNGYSAEQTVPYPWFKLSAIRATRRACPDLSREVEFLAALSEMTLIEASGDTLILRNDAGREMVFLAVRP